MKYFGKVILKKIIEGRCRYIMKADTDKKLIVAGIQILCNSSKIDMLNKAESYINQSCSKYKNVDLIVLPEQFYQLDSNKDNNWNEEYGEEEHGLFEKTMCSIAKKYKVNIIAGTYAVKQLDKIKNRSLAINRAGSVVGYYDKIHLFDAFGIRESDTFSAGNELGIFQFDFGKVGVFVCYDLRFPEISRAIRLKNDIDVLCVPAAFYKPHNDQWEILIKSAAIYNVTPVVAVNQYGQINETKGFVGRSMAVDAKGIVLAGVSDKEGYYVTEIEKEYTGICRMANPELSNRRVDLYSSWI